MAEMIIKHAPEVLEKLDQTQKDVAGAVDYMVFWRSSEIGVERNMLIEHNAA